MTVKSTDGGSDEVENVRSKEEERRGGGGGGLRVKRHSKSRDGP